MTQIAIDPAAATAVPATDQKPSESDSAEFSSALGKVSSESEPQGSGPVGSPSAALVGSEQLDNADNVNAADVVAGNDQATRGSGQAKALDLVVGQLQAEMSGKAAGTGSSGPVEAEVAVGNAGSVTENPVDQVPATPTSVEAPAGDATSSLDEEPSATITESSPLADSENRVGDEKPKKAKKAAATSPPSGQTTVAPVAVSVAQPSAKTGSHQEPLEFNGGRSDTGEVIAAPGQETPGVGIVDPQGGSPQATDTDFQAVIETLPTDSKPNLAKAQSIGQANSETNEAAAQPSQALPDDQRLRADGSQTEPGKVVTSSPLVAVPDARSANPPLVQASPSAPPAGNYSMMAPEASPSQQIANAIRQIRKLVDGTHRLSLELHPRQLGTVNLEVAYRNGQLHLHAVAENVGARNTLEQAMPSLRAELDNLGLTAGNLQVSPDTRDQAGQRNPFSKGSNRRQFPLPGSRARVSDGSMAITPQPTRSGLDLRI